MPDRFMALLPGSLTKISDSAASYIVLIDSISVLYFSPLPFLPVLPGLLLSGTALQEEVERSQKIATLPDIR